MHVLTRPARQDDEPLLWHMLYYASHMYEEEGQAIETEAAKNNPGLQKYVQGWGREGDIGVVAVHLQDQRPLGAAWVRVLSEEKSMSSAVKERTPELAIAVLPAFVGQGIGTQLLQHLLAAARVVYPAVVLSVRTNNPARKLYERMGFRVVDSIVNRVGSASVVMLIEFDRMRS